MAYTAGIRQILSKSCVLSSHAFRGFHRGAALLQHADSKLTLCHNEDGIRIITLNNVKKRNALSLAMLDSLKSDLTREDGDDLRVIVIRGAGPVFSAGHDLKELTSETGQGHHEKVFRRCTEVMSLVQDLPVPVIAEVRGLATAAGCQLVAAADIAIATDTSKFSTPGVSVGLFCSTPGIPLARAVPRKVALEMLFSGNPITAQAALQHGLVSRLVPEEQLENEVMTLARRICSVSRPVTALGKAFFYKQIEMDRDTAFREGEKVMVENLRLRDAQEGIKAFSEKRPAIWSNTDEKAH